MSNRSRVLALFMSGALSAVLFTGQFAEAASSDLLVKIDAKQGAVLKSALKSRGAQVEALTTTLRDGSQWVQLSGSGMKNRALSMKAVRAMKGVVAVQPNYEIHMYGKDSLVREMQNPAKREAATRYLSGLGINVGAATPVHAMLGEDNPAFPAPSSPGSGADPDFSKQWGMNDIGVQRGWNGKQGEGMIVAVLDSGVDYTHEDLVDNMWHNPGETGVDANGKDKATNGVDDDGNGYIDDVVGWDFVSNDNKPYDLAFDDIELLMRALQGQGGNPGHGTHCAGNVAGRGDNGKGITGVAPKAKIMALRFLSEEGSGDTAGAVKAIQYATKMGVKVSSNSWGSSGEDPNDAAGNQALRDVIEEARLAGQLFVAAAGNGDAQGKGYDNDTSDVPAYPASYQHENIVSVAAIDSSDALGGFSNWGKTSVDIGAPGVKVFSTTVANGYNDQLIFGMATWDGTSMAAPHVAGAAALYWADHANASMMDVKNALLKSVKSTSSLSGKVTSGGKLNVENLMK